MNAKGKSGRGPINKETKKANKCGDGSVWANGLAMGYVHTKSRFALHLQVKPGEARLNSCKRNHISPEVEGVPLLDL